MRDELQRLFFFAFVILPFALFKLFKEQKEK